MLNRGGPLSKLISGTIGLAEEYRRDSKERKTVISADMDQPSSSNPSTASQGSTSGNEVYCQSHLDQSSEREFLDDEDRAIELDEIQQMRERTRHSQQNNPTTRLDADDILRTFAQRHPEPQTRTCELPMPVLLPQRRPKSQHKGFIRAYAPVLGNCGIDQETWFEFLDGLENSINKNAWFHVTNAGAMMVGSAAALTLGVDPLLHMVSMALHASIEASRRGYLNYQQNNYLDVMNHQFFMPRGLYCMIVKYKPSSNKILENDNLLGIASETIEGLNGKSKWTNVISSSSMTITNDLEMPAVAPLVFPGLMDATEQQPKSNSIKQFAHVMEDYKNRRAAAKFEAENPNNRMPTTPRRDFTSLNGDPTSTVNKGGFISMVTGGKLNPVGPSGVFHEAQREKRRDHQAKHQQRRDKRPMSKVLKSEALYLMVTNLPSREFIHNIARRPV